MTRELRRTARDAERSDYLILITLIILIMGRRVGGCRRAGRGTPQRLKKRSGRWLLSDASELSEESRRRVDDGEGDVAVKHYATIERAVAVEGRMRRRCNHPRTKQGRER